MTVVCVSIGGIALVWAGPLVLPGGECEYFLNMCLGLTSCKSSPKVGYVTTMH